MGDGPSPARCHGHGHPARRDGNGPRADDGDRQRPDDGDGHCRADRRSVAGQTAVRGRERAQYRTERLPCARAQHAQPRDLVTGDVEEGLLLVVIDNCEHVVGTAAGVLGALASGVPGLRVLATSREPLGVDVEHVLALRPLAIPAGPRPQDVLACGAGRLFLDCALATSPRFRLDEAAAHIAAICRRLDELPLATELAAARVRNFDVMELAAAL